MRKMPRAVIFFGPDGAGKSTQAKLLIKHLESQRLRVRWTWIRGRHSLAFVLSNFLKKQGYYIIATSGDIPHKVFDPRLMPKLQRVWVFIEFISVLPWIITRMYFPMAFGYIVVAERYVIDTLVYMGYWISPVILRGFMARILLSLIPRDSILIYLNAQTETLLNRIKDDTATHDFIVFQQQAYDELARRLGAHVIDTTISNAQETFQKILGALAN
jgi:thymidylate kinase